MPGNHLQLCGVWLPDILQRDSQMHTNLLLLGFTAEPHSTPYLDTVHSKKHSYTDNIFVCEALQNQNHFISSVLLLWRRRFIVLTQRLITG
ncbi:hypothetical protein AOLI_G00319590 [Acnodon oligacanthus]